MKKKIWFMLILMGLALNLNAQNDSIVRITKFDALNSQKGVVMKFVDKKIKDLVINDPRWGLNSKIRTFLHKDGNTYFLIIKSDQKVTYIEYSDLVELNKAFDKLLNEVDADCASNPDYLENRYITDDGFEIGYYIKKGKPHWVMDFDTFKTYYGLIEIKEPYEFSKGLKEAQNEIEMMINGK